MTRRPRDVARHLEPEQAKLYELIWTRTIASQMESAELERTTVDILAEAGARRLDFRATRPGRALSPAFWRSIRKAATTRRTRRRAVCRRCAAGERLTKERIDATPAFHRAAAALHRSDAGQADGGARHRPSLDLRLDARGAARPRLRADREEAADSRGQGPAGDGLPRSLLRQIRRLRLHRRSRGEARQGLQQRDRLEGGAARLLERFFRRGRRHQGTAHRRRCSTASTSCSGPHIFPARADGGDAAALPALRQGAIVAEARQVRRLHRLLELSRMQVHPRPLADRRRDGARASGRACACSARTRRRGEEVTLRNGRFGDYVQQGEGEKPKRSSLPRGLKPDDVTLEKALALLSLPREVARHPTSGEPIVAGIGRYGAYVQHGKTYANLGRDDDVLEIGGNRAIDLIVAKESGAGAARFGGGGSGRVARRPSRRAARSASSRAASAPTSITARSTRRCRKGTDPASLTLDEAVGAARGEGGGRRRGGGRLLGDHPERRPGDGARRAASALTSTGARSTRRSRSPTRPDSVTLADAIELIAEREGKPAPSARKAPAKAPPKKAAPAKAPAKSAPAKSKAATAKKKPPAKSAAKAKPRAAAGRT